MPKFEITPEQMVQIANDLKTKIEEWNTSVKMIYSYHQQLEGSFEGTAKAAWDKRMEEDLPKYNKLSEIMAEYAVSINQSAVNYNKADAEAADVIKR